MVARRLPAHSALPRCRALAALLLVPFLFLVLAAPALGQGRTTIRDAEIESILRLYADPLFVAAGLTPSAVDLILVEDDALNAFVAGGQNIFVHTGLLTAAEGPLEVIGVLAHEVGHITGGHSIARLESLQNTQSQLIATYLLAAGAALATGQPALGGAIVSGGQDLALRGFLSFSRQQEQTADQAGITLMERTEQSPRGLISFMDRLRGQEVLLTTSQDPYLRTHPLTEDRMQFLERALAASPYADAPVPPEIEEAHRRLRAKLIAFITPQRVPKLYPASDDSVAARYARSIADYRQVRIDEALAGMDGLIESEPENPYFHELKGQMLLESGQVEASLAPYRRAVELAPEAPQLQWGLSRALVQRGEPAADEEALGLLDRVLAREPNNVPAWRLVAIARGRLGQQGLAALALAEVALGRGQLEEAKLQSQRALKAGDLNAAGKLRAEDLTQEAERRLARRRN